MMKMMGSMETITASMQPDGGTPVPKNAWQPIRAFVEYEEFEKMMKSELLQE